MLETLSGATRVHFIVGHPIVQVKSPAGLTRAFATRNVDAAMIPIDAPPDAVDGFFATARALANVDGVVATVPYKFKARENCDSVTDRAAVLGVANVLRRTATGGWHGDMTDGLGFCDAVRNAGFEIAGTRALLIGAGGAGSAIALALLDRGAGSLVIHDVDRGRADALAGRLASVSDGVTVADALPDGDFDLVANASPLGMRPGDPLPFPPDRLRPGMHFGDVVTPKETAPMVREARARGCTAHTGIDMFEAQVDLIADFLLGAELA